MQSLIIMVMAFAILCGLYISFKWLSRDGLKPQNATIKLTRIDETKSCQCYGGGFTSSFDQYLKGDIDLVINVACGQKLGREAVSVRMLFVCQKCHAIYEVNQTVFDNTMDPLSDYLNEFVLSLSKHNENAKIMDQGIK